MKSPHNYLMILLAAAGLATLMTVSNSCNKDEDNNSNNVSTFTDPRDGNVYKTVQIGDQVWMAENLRYLPSVSGPVAGSKTTALYYVMGYDGVSTTDAMASSYFTPYGVLYNWPAAMDACPAGWHLPTEAEWLELATYLGGSENAGGKLKEEGFDHWSGPNEGATNETGFTALPGGFRMSGGDFNDIGNTGSWWTANEIDADMARYILMTYTGAGVYYGQTSKALGFSILCVKD